MGALLDAALENSVDAPFACKVGVCSTCKAKILKGEVEMIANHALVMVNAARGREQLSRPTRLIFDEGHHLFDVLVLQTLEQIRCGTLDLKVSCDLQVLKTQDTYHSKYRMVAVVAA